MTCCNLIDWNTLTSNGLRLPQFSVVRAMYWGTKHLETGDIIPDIDPYMAHTLYDQNAIEAVVTVNDSVMPAAKKVYSRK